MSLTTLATQLIMYAGFPFVKMYLPNCYHSLKLIGLVSSFVHNHFLISGDYDTVYGFLSKINYDLIFMAQGIIDFLCIEQTTAEWESISKTPWTPFIMMVVQMCIALTMPMNNTREGYLFYYPIY